MRLSDDPVKIYESRKEFEDLLYADYFVRSIKFKPNKQFAECNVVAKNEFFALDDDGHYKREDVSAMWYGWSLAKGIK